MKRQILCLSGWGQKFDSLEEIFTDPCFDDFDVTSFDYSALNSVEEFFSKIKSDSEIVIGWSLGGQLLVRAIEKDLLRPKLLILIAPPFQMVKDSRIQAAMAQNTFTEFYQNFKKSPDATLKKFAILMAMNDKNSAEIAQSLDVSDENLENWTFWLEELEKFSCFDIDFAKMPKTLYFHGYGDMIVHISQMDYFKNKIADFNSEIFRNCGHAPHINDLSRMQKRIFLEIEGF